MSPPADPPRPVRLVVPRDDEPESSESFEVESVSLSDKVDTAINDVRALHVTSRETRQAARAAAAIAGRVEGVQRDQGEAIARIEIAQREHSAALSDLEARELVREARADARAKAIAKTPGRTATTTGGAVVVASVLAEIARHLIWS